MRRIGVAIALLLACQRPADPNELARRLREGTPAERADALTQMGGMIERVRPILPEIEQAALDRDVAVRRAAVATLAAFGSDAKEGLLLALGDADADVRRVAADALAAQGITSEALVPELVTRLSSDDFRVAAAAGRALVQIGESTRPALARVVIAGDEDARDTALRALVELGEGSIPDLAAAARADDPKIRASAIESLIVLGAPADAVLQTYRVALRDRDGGVRDAAARAVQSLGAAGAPAAADLVPLLADEDNAGPAAWALRDIGEAAIPTLLTALTDERAAIRRGAAQCLATIGDARADVRTALTTAQSDPDPSVQREAAAALQTLAASPARAHR